MKVPAKSAGRLRGLLPMAGIMAALALTAGVFMPLNLNEDSSWYLVATRMWLNGGTLYRDIMEINPPLAFYLTAPGLVLADRLGLTDSAGYVLFLVTIAGFSLFWIRSLLRRAGNLGGYERAALLVAAGIALLLLPMPAFGQREHMAMAFGMPYLLALALGIRLGRPEAFAIGAYAVLGLALKPHYLAAPALLALATAVQARSLRPLFQPANLAVGAGCLAYLGLAALLHPEYFTTMIPLGQATYGAYGLPARAVLTRVEPFALLLALAIWRLDRRGRAADPVFPRLFAICAGFFLAYIVQFKGWASHLLPLAGFLIVLLAWIATRHGPERRPRLVFVLVLALLVAGPRVLHGPYRNDLTERFLPLAAAAGPVPALLVLSTTVGAGFPLVNEAKARWTSRYPAQWLVPGALKGASGPDCTTRPISCEKSRQVLDYARRTTVDDFLAMPPDIVFVDSQDRKQFFGDAAFDYLEFLKADPRFPAAWASYRQVDTVSGYTVWRRVPLP